MGLLKTRMLCWLPSMLLGICCGALLTLPVSAAEQPAAPPDPAEIAELMEESGRLAPQHEKFKVLAGNWKVDAEYYWDNPKEAKRAKATATFEVILGGRFVQQIFHGTLDGKPYEGRGISGYDKTKKKYVGIWIDDMSTGMMIMEGQQDEDGNTVDYGESESPMGKMKVKMITTPVKDGKFVFTMYMILPDGTEQKGMVLTYTRK